METHMKHLGWIDVDKFISKNILVWCIRSGIYYCFMSTSEQFLGVVHDVTQKHDIFRSLSHMFEKNVTSQPQLLYRKPQFSRNEEIDFTL